jgi:hypothetical protein
MEAGQFFVSLIGGGLAGGCVNVISGRLQYWRNLRTQFHPILNSFWGAYLVRMEKPEGRYWLTVVGDVPLRKDADFVGHRTQFVLDLVRFNELREARELRLIKNLNPGFAGEGTLIKADLMPEYEAVQECLETVQKKLKLT